jgi:hypothetical protein
VRAIGLILAARFRQQWRAWLLLTVLVSVGTGLVLSAVTAGRRADTAFPGFLAAHGYDAIVYTAQPLPQLATLPDVTQVVEIRAPFEGQPWCSCGKQINQGDFAVREIPPTDLQRVVKLVDGRMPDQSDPGEALVSFTMQRDYGIGPGTLIRLPMTGADQRSLIEQAMQTGAPPPAKPDGPVITVRVTGVVAAENEFPSGQGATAVALVGTAAGIGLATLLSPLTPVGEARLATPTPGLLFDWPANLAGGAAALAAVLLLGLPPALRSARRHVERDAPVIRRSLITHASTGAGLPAAVILGIRRAVDRGRGASAVPVRAGLAGALAAVTALCAIAVFGASLANLMNSPDLYGDAYTAYFNGGLGGVPTAKVVSELEHDPAVDRVTLATSTAITVGTVSVRALEAAPTRGAMLLSPAGGRLPVADDEIVLGISTLRNAGAHIGGTVPVTIAGPDGKPRTSSLRVVGTVPFPPDLGFGGLGTGAALTAAAYLAVQCPSFLPAAQRQQCRTAAGGRPVDAVLMHTVPGPAGAAALTRYASEYPGNTSVPTVPTALASFGESANFPLIIAIVVATAGLGALAHLLAVSVARRRRESGLLKALGFIRPQLAAIVFWQTATLDLIAIAAGVPLGVVLDRVIWRVFAGDLGVVPFTVYPGWQLGAIASGFLLASLAIAALPAWATARARTSQLLRAE